MKRRFGQSTVEILIAAGVFSVLGAGVLLLVLNPLGAVVNSGNRVEASTLVTQGLEASRAIKERNWTELTYGTHGLALDGSDEWIFSGSSDVTETIYTRQTVVTEVNRDGGGDITESGGTLDERTKKVTVTVSWTSGLIPIPRSVSRSIFFTDWAVYDWTETTDTDFGDGTPTDIRVVGTGDGASLELDPSDKQWLFSNGDVTIHTTDEDWAGISTAGSFTDDTESEFNAGNHVDTQYDNVNDWLEINNGPSTTTYGEAGTFTSPIDGGWQLVNFNNTYTTPVVVGTTQTATGGVALVFEVRNVTSTSAEMRLCESEGSTASGCNTHAAETGGYMVIDAATANALDGIEAGTFSVAGEFDTTTVTTNYAESFTTAPIVLANVQGPAGTTPVEVRVTTTGTGSFTSGLCQHLVGNNDNCDGSHVSETVGWVAIEPGNNPFDEQIETGTVSVSNSAWTAQVFGTAFSSTPVVVVEQQTNNGGQDGEIDEARSVTTTGMDVRYCELDTAEDCDTHTGETMGWVAFENGDLSIASGGGATSGTFTSAVYDASSTSTWDVFEWVPQRPLGKELPGSTFIESGYPAGNAVMTGNVLLMHLNEAGGSTSFSDSSGAGNGGTCSSCPTSGVAGKLNTSSSFDGQNNEINVNDAASLDMSDEVTIEGWFKVEGDGRTSGDMFTPFIDTLEYTNFTSSGIGREPDFINISGNVYAVAYRGDGTDGYVATFTIDDNGNITDAVIDQLEYDTSNGQTPDIKHVSGDIYVIAYEDSGNDGAMATLTIDAAGNIGGSVLDYEEFNTSNGETPKIIPVSGNIWAIAYDGPGSDGWVETRTIDTGTGDISNASIDTMEFDTTTGLEPDIINVSGNVYAVAYTGPGNDGFIKTFTIDGAGNISSVIDTYEHDTSTGLDHEWDLISGSVFALTYRGAGSDGWITTITIDGAGNIGSEIDSFEFDTVEGNDPDLQQVDGDLYGVVWEGLDEDGFVATMTIDSSGNISTAIETIEFEVNQGMEVKIIPIARDIFGLAYRGIDDDGFMQTFRVATDTYRGTYKPDAYGISVDSSTAYGRINGQTISTAITTGGGGGGTPTYVRSNSGAATSITLDIGSNTGDRLVTVHVSDETTTNHALTITVDGNSCTEVIDGVNTDGAGNYQALFYCDDDDLGSSSGTVTVAETSGSCTGTECGIIAQLFTGVSQSGPHASAMDTTSLDDTVEASIDVPTGGLVVMGAGNGNAGTWDSWTSPLTESEDFDAIAGGAPFGSAYGVEASSQTGKQYQATASAAFNRGSAAVASWSPAGGGGGSGGWNHIALTYDKDAGSDQIKLYVNGAEATTGTLTSAITQNNQPFLIGSLNDTDIDELAVFNRALSATEINDHYRRGATRAQFQIRSCDDASCSGESFQGPDGTGSTYFTELANGTTSPPTFNLTNVPNNQYFQYQVSLSADSTSVSPEIKSVTGEYRAFSGSIGTFIDTEVTGTGEPASVREKGTPQWFGAGGQGSFFFHTDDTATEFGGGTFSDTVMVGTGDPTDVQLDEIIDWRFFTSPTSETLHDAQVISSTEGYAAGENGTLLEYDGSAWSVMTTPTSEDLYDIFITSSVDGWAVGLNGETLRWNGSTWSDFTSFTSTDLWELSCVDEDNCWASGSGGEIWYWNGSTWVQQTTPTTNTLFDIAMLNTSFGWAAGVSGTILQWNGSTWSTETSPVSEDWRDITMLSTTDGFITGPNGAIIKWNGTSWASETSPTTEICRGITMLSPTFAFAVCNNGEILRWDGASWSLDVSPSTASLKDVQPISSTEAWAVGENGEILRYGPHFKTSGTFESVILDAGATADWGSVSWTEILPTNTDVTIATRSGPTATPDGGWSGWSAELTDPSGGSITSPDNRYLQYRMSFTSSNPSATSVMKSIKITYNEPPATQLNGVVTTTAADGWAVGNAGVILRYDGASWGLQTSPTTDDLFGVEYADANNVWAVGENGRVSKWNGTSWANETSPTSEDLNSVDILSATDGHAVGANGEILRLTGSGWSTIASPTGNDLQHVDMVSSGDGFAVGASGTIARWNGSTWSTVSSPTSSTLYGVEMLSGTDGWAVGASGVIARWNGSTWSTVSSPTATTLRAVSCVSATDCRATGDLGVILHWNGTIWAPVSSPTSESLRAVHMDGTNDGWAVGTLGTIVRYANLYPSTGTFISKVVDGTSPSTSWDVIYWDLTQPIGTDITIATRSGPTPEPDGGWSSWSTELTTPGGSLITSPDNRYFQYRAIFTSSTQLDTALLNRVEIISNAATVKNLFGVEGVTDDDVWAVGRDGVIVHYDGSSWTLATSPIATDIYGIDAANAIDVFAVGNAGKIIRYNGSSWISQTSPVFDDLRDVSMIDGTDGFAVGGNGNGIIVRWNGTSWSSVTSPTTDELYSVSMIDANDGFAVGEDGRIIRWNGTSWSNETSPVSTDLNHVHMLSSTFGWAVGDGGVILQWNGSSWSTVTSPVNVKLNSVEAKNAGTAWAVGDFGTILEYSGGSWNTFSGVSTGQDLHDLTVFNPTDGWIVGELGNIFKDPVVYPTFGQYLSSVLNTDSTTSTYLTTYWDEVLPTSTDITIAFRTGNTAVPDVSWSAWGSELSTASGTEIVITDAQYLQYRATMTTSDTAVTPTLEEITVTYKQ